ncbi:hypothetical protein BGP75_14475 [Motiliproteus sp. MSK22-1]|nr:hypothetical protein BGP75_14475 [Motiliproteus sp. MSK22-1]
MSLVYLLLSSFIFNASVAVAENKQPVVIINSQVPYDHLSRSVLRSIFSMRLTRWADGTPIRVFVLPDDHAIHRRFSKRTLAVFPYQLRQTWDRAVYSGTGQAPVQIKNQQLMLEAVAQTPGAIGYIVDGNRAGGVRYVVLD